MQYIAMCIGLDERYFSSKIVVEKSNWDTKLYEVFVLKYIWYYTL